MLLYSGFIELLCLAEGGASGFGHINNQAARLYAEKMASESQSPPWNRVY